MVNYKTEQRVDKYSQHRYIAFWRVIFVVKHFIRHFRTNIQIMKKKQSLSNARLHLRVFEGPLDPTMIRLIVVAIILDWGTVM